MLNTQLTFAKICETKCFTSLKIIKQHKAVKFGGFKFKQKEINMKALKRTLISFVCLIAVLGIVIVGGYIFVRSKYGIDLFRTAGQLKTLTQTVDETTLCPNALNETDFEDLKTYFSGENFTGLVKYDESKGYKGYYTDFAGISGGVSSAITLTEKYTGALAQIIFYEQTGGKIQVGEKELTTTIVQVDFSNIEDNGSADFNIVVKIDLTPLKDDMSSFPYNLFKKYIPDNLYISSTIRIDKTDEYMAYTVSHKQLTINKLSADDTNDLFHTLDAVLKLGSAENLNLTIGNTVANVLIGNEQNTGFVYSLKAVGKTACGFQALETTDAFVIS